MKGLGASAAGAAALGSNRGFTATASANGTLEMGIASTVIGGPAMAVGWALREYEIIGSDGPAEGLTADALREQIRQAMLTRQSTNASTIVDNGNILDGVQNTAYIDGKVSAIEALNAGKSESEVVTAATTAVDAYHTTVAKNFLKTWNESVQEIESFVNAVDSHPDLSQSGVLSTYKPTDSLATTSTTFPVNTITLADGSSFDIKSIGRGTDYDVYDPAVNVPDWEMHMAYIESGSVQFSYMVSADWISMWDNMETTFSDARSGVQTWVSNVYGDVQSGDIEISDLVTPRERASMMADGEGSSQAIADLIALNVPVDLEREATVTIGSTGATLSGTFALTDSSDGPIESGTTYDPSTFTGDVYFTADMSLVEGDWTAIQDGVDGGTIAVTSEPYAGTAIEVTTVDSETVSVPAADWTDNGDGTWSYDASGDLETTITTVDSARFVSTATETQYNTIQLQSSFTVDKLVNTETGEEVNSTSFTDSEPQTDSNYITQEEWDQLEQQNQELIDKFENSQSGGSFSLDGLDMFGLPGEVVALIVAALVMLGILGN